MKKKLVEGDFFYGWYIVAAGFLIMAVAWGIVYNCSSLFIIPISQDLGFTRSQINLTMTIRSSFQVLISLFSGIIFARYNMKKMMEISVVSLFISYFLHSFVSSLPVLYILTAIAAISTSLITVLPLAIILNNWFNESRGVAIGIAFMGSGVGGMILGGLTGRWIEYFGWRIAYRILSVIMVTVLIPSIFYIVHSQPSELGLEPLGGYSEASKSGNAEYGITLSEAKKTIVFWGIITCTLFISLGGNALMTSVAPHLEDVGYTSIFSSNIVALTMGSLAIGKIILGRMYDKYGVRIAGTVACLSTLIGLVGLVFAKSYIGLFAIILGSGIGSAYGTVSNPIITHSLFGKKDYGSINGVLQAANGMGGVLAPMLLGIIYDSRGSYLPSYMVMIVMGIIATTLYQFILPREKLA